MSATALFPMYFLKSFAYAGVATVAFVATASIVITPAAIVLLGPRLDALDVRRLVRRLLGRPDPVHKPVKQLFWYRSSKFVMRRWLPVGTAVVALLVLLGLPFLSVKWGFPDDRVLPRSASARQVGDILRDDFGHDPATQIPIVVPDARGLGPVELDSYAAELSRVPDVSAVAAPTGTFVDGSWVGTPRGATGLAEGSAFLTVSSTAPLFSRASDIQLKRLHQVAGPAGRSVVMAGVAQVNRDSVDAVTDRLPMVLGLIAAITYVLLFLLTGSVVLPAKALVCNVLSLTAAFGALSRKAISVPWERLRAGRWWRICRSYCFASHSVCPWTTRCFWSPGFGSTGWNPEPRDPREEASQRCTPPTTRASRSAWPAPVG